VVLVGQDNRVNFRKLVESEYTRRVHPIFERVPMTEFVAQQWIHQEMGSFGLEQPSLMAEKRGRKHESRILPANSVQWHLEARFVMKAYFRIVLAVAFTLTGSSSIHLATPPDSTPDAATLSRAGLPTEQMAKTVLSAALKD